MGGSDEGDPTAAAAGFGLGEGAPVIPGVVVERPLGAGATSRVYLGRQEHLDRPVAVKVVHGPLRDDVARRLLDNEGRMLGLLSAHPGILTVHDAGTTADGQPYLVSEYLPGGTLEQVLHDRGPLDWTEVADLGVQLAGALATAHEHGVVHGDVRLRNVLVGHGGRPVLGDFGISTVRGSLDPAPIAIASRLAPPEVRAGLEPSARTDIHDVAACLHLLLGGGLPEFGSDPEGARWPELPDATAPAGLRELITEATSPDPQGRPTSARAVGEALRGVQLANGEAPTDLEVFDDLGTVPEPRDGGGAPGSLMVPTTTRGARPDRGWRTLALAALVLASAGSVAALLWWDPQGDDGSAGPTSVAPTTVPPTSEPAADGGTDRADLPESDVQGVQPGVGYDVGGRDTSRELDEVLSEESLIFLPLEARPVVEAPYYSVPFTGLPAAFHFQAFNPDGDGATCTGMMSRELVVTGMWERASQWQDGWLRIAVAEFADEEMAHEMATAISLTAGAQSEQCRGMARWGVEDYGDYGVLHRDTLGLLPPGDRYNHWSGTDVIAADRVWSDSARMVLERGPFVVDVALVTSTPLPMGDDRAVAEIAEQVINRL